MIKGSRTRRSEVALDEQRPVAAQEWRALSSLVRGELSFLLFTAVCVALHPGIVLKFNEGGMTNYGLHAKTVIPYTLALGLLVVFSLRAAALYDGDDVHSRRLRLLVWTYSATVLSVLLSTYVYSLGPVAKDVHFMVGTALVLVVAAASIWIYQQWPRTWSDRLLLGLQLVADASALFTAVGDLHVLFLAEILSNVSFAGLLIRNGRRRALLEHRDEPQPADAHWWSTIAERSPSALLRAGRSQATRN